MPLSDVRKVARLGEPDRYLAALLAPADAAPGLIALAAFAAELARIPASVSDPMMGEIRLQWWRDALEAAARGASCGHPVADVMGDTLRRHGLSLASLQRMIDARGFDLSGDLHADLPALEAHLAETEGVPFTLAAEIIGRPLPPSTAARAGFAYGLARALGRLPPLLHNGGFPIPEDMLAAHGVARGQLAERPFAAATAAGVRASIADLHAKVLAALAELRIQQQQLAVQKHAGLLPVAMVEPYLKAQSRKQFSALDAVGEVLPLVRVWTLGKARLGTS